MTDKEFRDNLDTSKPVVKINGLEVYLRSHFTRRQLKRLKKDTKTANMATNLSF